MKLEDRVAIVTGDGYGIGKEYCLALADQGAKVPAADIDLEGAKEAAKETQKRGGEGAKRLCPVCRA